MASKVIKLVTHINTSFYDYKKSRDILIDNSIFKDKVNNKSKEINNICKKISDNKLNLISLHDNKRYFHIASLDYFDYKRNEQDKPILKIDNVNGNYYLSTGIYCGVINLGDNLPPIEIKTGYSDLMFKRMLNYCCGVYADTNATKRVDESESIYSLLIQYLYLISLRKVANKAIPKKYVYLKERGYDIKGCLDINEYVNRDLIAFDKKITYKYAKRLEIQSVIDVLYVAMECCQINQMNKVLPNMFSFRNYLKELYSGKKPAKKVIKNAINEKCLKNSLYLDFKLPLEYARILLESNDVNNGNNKKVSGLSGFLVDASFLWEMYLCNLMRLHLKDWNIDSQSEITFYECTFFKKKNYPDFVLRHKETGAVFILDAKFKRMEFSKVDVDNNDLQQLHAYSYYFHLKEGEKFKGAALIYPTTKQHSDSDNSIDNIFGLSDVKQKFAIFTIKDPSENETIVENENNFINKLKSFLNECM